MNQISGADANVPAFTENNSELALAERDSQVQAALLNCYLSTLETVAESMSVLCPEVAYPFKERLLLWPHRIICDTSAKTLDQCRAALRSELRSFSESASHYLREASHSAPLATPSAQVSFTMLRENSEAHYKLTDAVCEQIEAGADVDNADRFRSMLRQQVIGLRANAGRMQDEVAKALKNIIEESQVLQGRIGDPAYLANTDETTCLLSQPGMVHKLNDYLGNPGPSSTLIFKLEGYASIPVEQAKVLVRRLADHLRNLLRPTDLASRWAEDRFLVFFRGEAHGPDNRAKQIASVMSDRYFLECNEMQGLSPSVNTIYWSSEGSFDIWDLIERVNSA